MGLDDVQTGSSVNSCVHHIAPAFMLYNHKYIYIHLCTVKQTNTHIMYIKSYIQVHQPPHTPLNVSTLSASWQLSLVMEV